MNFSVFTEPGAIMPNGAISFFTASALLYFPMGGAKFVAELGGEIKDPGKTIPRSMFLSTGIVAVFYALMGVVAAGVLPVEEVAGKTLVVSAKEIFPTSVYLFFVIGGALFALATTLNGTLSWITKGLFVASKEGWFPESLADTNKHGVPYKLLLIFLSSARCDCHRDGRVLYLLPGRWTDRDLQRAAGQRRSPAEGEKGGGLRKRHL